MVVVAAFGMMSMLNAALLATAAMLLTGCLTSNRVWRRRRRCGLWRPSGGAGLLGGYLYDQYLKSQGMSP